MPLLISSEAIKQGLTGGLLQVHVERRIDSQSTFVDLIAAVFCLQITPYFLYVIRGQRIGISLQVERDRLALGCGSLTCGNLAVLKHGIEHQVAPFKGAFRMSDWRIILR